MMQSPSLFGLLDSSQFNFKSLDPYAPYNGFPSSLQLQIHILNNFLNVKLFANSEMNRQIYTKDDSGIHQNDQKLVFKLKN